MMNTLYLFLAGLLLVGCSHTPIYELHSLDEATHTSLLDIPVVDIDGNKYDKLGELVKGKKCIIVANVATNWGLARKNYT